MSVAPPMLRRWREHACRAVLAVLFLAHLPGAAGQQVPVVEPAEEPRPPAAALEAAVEAAAPGPTAADPAPAQKTESTVRSLEAFLRTIESKQAQVDALRERFQEAVEDVTRNQLLEQLEEATREAEALDRQFEEFAVAVDVSAFVEEEQTPFDWQDELAGLVRPIVAEIKNATAGTRAIGELRAGIEEATEREAVAAEAVANLERLLAADPGENLEQRLQTDLGRWRQRREDAANRATALQLQLDNRLAERTSVLDETTSYVRDFLRTRGLNLLLGIGAFVAVFLGVRLLGRLYDRLQSSRGGRSFSNRMAALLFQLFSVVGGVAATLLVFNLAGDWFLLGIVLIFLLGVGWASINTLPRHFEAIKLMLNIGPVKEGERLDFDGSPWCVESLGFSARLVNPLLDGGTLVLPVRFLVDLYSRPFGQGEALFPCRRDDWVELDDGRVGRVVNQNPATVELMELGGSRVVYQTRAFLGLSPRNLSAGFRLSLRFDLDHRHLDAGTDAIPGALQERLEQALPAVAGDDALRRVRVEFEQAKPSSLAFAVEVDLDGAVAERLPELRRAVARLLVEASRENGWTLPFPQLVVHQRGED
jgi:hypothetical protein